MSVLRAIAKRLLLGVVAAWGVFTTIFLAFTVTDDWVEKGIEGGARFAGASESEIAARIEQYRASRGLDRPLHEQYVDWLLNTVTLDWGTSFVSGEPATGMVADAVVRTASYLLPAIVLGIVLGTSVGVLAALAPESRLAGIARNGSYVVFAVPMFWLGGLVVGLIRGEVLPNVPILYEYVLPIVLATATLLGGYVSYSRAYTAEHVTADSVTLVRAKGAGERTVARHVVRNAAIPLFSMLFVEAIALLVLAVFVIEVLFGIDGFGLLYFEAISGRDLPVLLGSTMIVVLVGVAGNVVQDLGYRYLDPTVE